MQITLDRLKNTLRSTLPQLIWLSGDEPYQCQEAVDSIRQYSQDKGIAERISLAIKMPTDWQQLYHDAYHYSLFSNHTLLEVRINLTPDEDAQKLLLQLATNPPPDKLLLLICAKLTPNLQNSSWFKTILNKHLVLFIWPLNYEQQLAWLKQRCCQEQLLLTEDAMALLVENTEGNLLAAAQIITKLNLSYPKRQNLNSKDIANIISQSAQYTIFDLVDNALLGNIKKTMVILTRLQDSHTEPTLIIWAIARELRLLLTIIKLQKSGSSLEQAFFQAKVFTKHKPYIKKALQRHDMSALHMLLKQTATLDQVIKGLKPGNIWQELTTLCLNLAGIKLPLFIAKP